MVVQRPSLPRLNFISLVEYELHAPTAKEAFRLREVISFKR